MKKLIFLLVAMISIVGIHAQTVGVGTNVPDSNAVLDIFSTTKGVLLPRLLDTANVPKPLEGLIIYNKNTKSPYYYNGSQWRSLGSSLPVLNASNTDHISYKITGPGFSATEEVVLSISQGVSAPTTIVGGTGGLTAAPSSLSSINLMKLMDVNSLLLNKAGVLSTKFPSIEIKLYATPTSTLPYASYRFKNIIIESYQISGSAGGGPVIESVSIAFENYGFKDWENNVEFGYDLRSKTLSTY